MREGKTFGLPTLLADYAALCHGHADSSLWHCQYAGVYFSSYGIAGEDYCSRHPGAVVFLNQQGIKGVGTITKYPVLEYAGH